MTKFSVNMSNISFARIIKRCAIVLGAFLLFELVIFNVVILYAFWSLKGAISDIVNSQGATFLDKLAVNPVFQDLVIQGKEGGFTSLIQNTVERFYIESYDNCARKSTKLKLSDSRHLSGCVRLGTLGLDVSGSGEALYIYRRIQQKLAQGDIDKVCIFLTEPPLEKTNNVVSKQDRHKPSCTSTDDG